MFNPSKPVRYPDVPPDPNAQAEIEAPAPLKTKRYPFQEGNEVPFPTDTRDPFTRRRQEREQAAIEAQQRAAAQAEEAKIARARAEGFTQGLVAFAQGLEAAD